MALPRQRQLVVPVADLLRQPGARKEVHVEAEADGLSVIDTRVPDGAPIRMDLEVEALNDGLMVTGHVSAAWEAACRRCLGPVTGRIEADVQELHKRAAKDDEAFAFEGDLLNLEPMLREVVMLELPLAPLCRPDCAGLCPVCGADRNQGDCGHHEVPLDPRWSALSELVVVDDTERMDPGTA